MVCACVHARTRVCVLACMRACMRACIRACVCELINISAEKSYRLESPLTIHVSHIHFIKHFMLTNVIQTLTTTIYCNNNYVQVQYLIRPSSAMCAAISETTDCVVDGATASV